MHAIQQGWPADDILMEVFGNAAWQGERAAWLAGGGQMGGNATTAHPIHQCSTAATAVVSPPGALLQCAAAAAECDSPPALQSHPLVPSCG